MILFLLYDLYGKYTQSFSDWATHTNQYGRSFCNAVVIKVFQIYLSTVFLSRNSNEAFLN